MQTLSILPKSKFWLLRGHNLWSLKRFWMKQKLEKKFFSVFLFLEFFFQPGKTYWISLQLGFAQYESDWSYGYRILVFLSRFSVKKNSTLLVEKKLLLKNYPHTWGFSFIEQNGLSKTPLQKRLTKFLTQKVTTLRKVKFSSVWSLERA